MTTKTKTKNEDELDDLLQNKIDELALKELDEHYEPDKNTWEVIMTNFEYFRCSNQYWRFVKMIINDKDYRKESKLETLKDLNEIYYFIKNKYDGRDF